ncbi:hypothetical protein [Paenibacillus graminis]|uniref:hypothetical protein n=1 Tax=Paenibacillus graminis TaxID=189425 RepID=UPI0030EEF18F
MQDSIVQRAADPLFSPVRRAFCCTKCSRASLQGYSGYASGHHLRAPCSRLPERKEYAPFSKEKDTPFSEAGQTAVIFLAAGVDNRYRMDYIYLNLKIINLKINKKAIGGEQG